MLATASNDGTARVWDPTTGQPVGDPLTGHTNWVTGAAWGQIGGRPVLATTSHNRTLRLWSRGTSQGVLRLAEPATAIAWSDDGRMAIGDAAGFSILTAHG